MEVSKNLLGDTRAGGNREAPPVAEDRALSNPLIHTRTVRFDVEGQNSTANAEDTWSIVHSYFAVMGGFSVVFAEGRPELLDLLPRTLQTDDHAFRLSLTADGVGLLMKEIPDLFANCSRRIIDDKSKASIFAKTLVSIQGILALSFYSH